DARALAGQALERYQGGAPAGRALVLQPAPQELGLLPKPELPDGAISDRALAVVGMPYDCLDLVAPLGTELRQLLLRARLGERIRLRGRLGERQLTAARLRGAGPTYRADGRKSRPVRFCSRMWADHPAPRRNPRRSKRRCGRRRSTRSARARRCRSSTCRSL